ncbi:hypothetical protein BN2364_0457 [Alloalcanivorax xenomutans]|uniref:phospholipase D family protein n=1 Tax=Alloalcanivorax xenomutans TaxID=1094342 RepID=UPI0006D5C382|nr:phospholipase D family protein [Alloalcanivorax xenomutans]CUR44898.1 hypothetical protein BN2364_0457 [Alloalcanivorax xenomutans]
MKPWKKALLTVLVLLIAIAIWQRYKPLPEGVGEAGPPRSAHQVALLVDDTWSDEQGDRHFDQAIFDEYFRLIGQARKLVVVDMFLFNTFAGDSGSAHRPLSEQLTAALLARHAAVPGLRMLVITDPFNTLYGGVRAPQLERLRQAGIPVVFTALPRLRDSNPSWSALWRVCCQWFGNSAGAGWLPNPTGGDEVTLRTYLSLLNFKANHRKTLVVDEGDDWTALVTSANAHDASSAHSNIALRFSGPAALDVLHSELAVARWSGAAVGEDWPTAPPSETGGDALPHLRLLTEGAIRDALLATVNEARQGEQLDVGVFYLSHRPLVKALAEAQRRGVRVRLLLDPNKDAFGREKNGVPNRQVAWELHDAGVAVRWCATTGEQCHTKMLLRFPAADSDRPARLILGSANYTRRNLDNLNLETSVEWVAGTDDTVISEARSTFEQRWSNPDDMLFSLPYEAYEDTSYWRMALYRIMEFTGWSTF